MCSIQSHYSLQLHKRVSQRAYSLITRGSQIMTAQKIYHLLQEQDGFQTLHTDVTKTRNGEWGMGNGKLKMGNGK